MSYAIFLKLNSSLDAIILENLISGKLKQLTHQNEVIGMVT